MPNEVSCNEGFHISRSCSWLSIWNSFPKRLFFLNNWYSENHSKYSGQIRHETVKSIISKSPPVVFLWILNRKQTLCIRLFCWQFCRKMPSKKRYEGDLKITRIVAFSLLTLQGFVRHLCAISIKECPRLLNTDKCHQRLIEWSIYHYA